MKKWLILICVLILVGVGWWFARQQRMIPLWAMPKFGDVTRGDIRVPITAAGLIHASQVIEVKPEASGEITEVRVVEGTYVHAGDTLVVLDPADEQRVLDQRLADHDRAQALLTQAHVAVDRAQVNIDSAKAGLEELKAQAQIYDFELAKIEETLDENDESEYYNPQQINDARARVRMNHAQQDSATIAIISAGLTKADAEAVVQSQEATVRSARKAMEDAEERLSETTILASRDGIVTRVFVKSGMLVQSGTQSLTGGTPLMMLADVSKKKVIARLDEADYGRVLNVSPIDALPEMPDLRETAAADAEQLQSRGGLVRLTVDAFPDDEFEGRIERVEPQGRLNAGSSIIQFDVHVEITDPQRHMLPLGAQAQVEFTVESAVDVLLVPAEGVKTRDGQRGVYVRIPPEPGSNEQFNKRFVACRFGISDGEHTQVIEILGNDKLNVGATIYTKMPQDVDEDEG